MGNAKAGKFCKDAARTLHLKTADVKDHLLDPEELRQTVPDARTFVNGWLAARKATYSYGTGMLTLGGKAAPIEVVFNELVLDGHRIELASLC